MYCKNCGKEIDNDAYVCVHCGVLVDKPNLNNEIEQKTSNNMAIAGFICSFFIPLLGWIFGGIGLAKSNKLPDNKGHNFSIASLIIATIMFIINLIIYFN